MSWADPRQTRRSFFPFERKGFNPSIVWCVTAVLALGVVGPGSASAAGLYERALYGKPLVEGLGFEGVLTIFDETPRMFRSLGRKPMRSADKPHHYRYASGAFLLTVQAEYRDGRFMVDTIQYSRDPGRNIATARGIRLQDPVGRVVDEYGNPDQVDGNEHFYRRLGVSFSLDEGNRVVAIAVFRPEDAIVGPESEVTEKTIFTGGEAKVSSGAENALLDAPGQLGVRLTLGPDWRLMGHPTSRDLTALGWEGRVMLRLVRCRRCGKRVSRTMKLLEGIAGPNMLAPRFRSMDREALLRVGGEAGLLGVYSGLLGGRTAWLMAVKKRSDWLLLVMTGVDAEHLTSEAQRGIVDILKGIQLLPSP